MRLAALLLAALGFAAPPPPVARPVAGEVSGKGPGPAPVVTHTAAPAEAAASSFFSPAAAHAAVGGLPAPDARPSPRHYLRHRAWLL